MKVFLGGTVAGSKWRDEIIPQLKVDYFNPVVDEWNDDAYKQELYEREHCEYCLYVLTPKMEGWYAVAEVVDDSYKRPDRTIFCFLNEDGKDVFTREQQSALNHLGVKAERNGATWLKSLGDVVDWLNSSNKRETDIFKRTDQFNNVFISYGRKHSLHFARYLHDRLVQAGKKVWFDMNNIPLAVDFQEQIDDGIEKADNFVFILSPHAVKSEYCMKEIILALRYNKRIIPILHVEPHDCWDKVHPEIAKRNWLYMRQQEEIALQNARKQLSDTQAVPISEWRMMDEFDTGFSRFLELIDSHNEYVRTHTLILHQALRWDRGQQRTNRLLIGEDRLEAEQWLLTTEFYDKETGKPVLPPCTPSELQSTFIVESKKNANNLLTDVFVSYAANNQLPQDRIVKSLNRHAITSWMHSLDIEKGTDFEKAIKTGIEQADNFLFFITHESVNSDFCSDEIQHALKHNKRIIPLLIENVDEKKIPPEIRKLQYIDFTDIDFLLMSRKEEEEEEVVAEELKQQKLSLVEKVERDVEQRKKRNLYERKIDELIVVLHKDEDYYNKHKVFLVQALKWSFQNKNESILLRGYNLENAKIWLRDGRNKQHKPITLHKNFIHESDAKKGLLRTDVFISYSRKDSDFARKLNDKLQIAGKNTWFDQESIASAADFQQEIFNGIEVADNFLFIISDDAVTSPYCEGEIQHAAKHNKRFISVLCRETQPKLLPDVLKSVQWIDFLNNEFSLAFNDVLRTLDMDREYIQSHTMWSQKAISWQKSGKDDALLLRGSEYAAAKRWLSDAFNNQKNPPPTAIQKELIEHSGSKERSARIVRWLSVVGILLLLLSTTLGIIAYQNAVKSSEQKEIALNEKAVADSLRQIAIKKQDEALEQRRIALSERKKAEESEKVARKNEQIANRERDKAVRLQLAANQSKNQALKDKRLAESLQKISYIDDYNDPVKSITEAVEAYIQAGDMVTLPVIRAIAKSYFINFDNKSIHKIGKSDISAFTPDSKLLMYGNMNENNSTELLLWDVENAKDSASFKTIGQVDSIIFQKDAGVFILQKPATTSIIRKKKDKNDIENIDYNRRDLSPDELRDIYYREDYNPFSKNSFYKPNSPKNIINQNDINQTTKRFNIRQQRMPITLFEEPQVSFDEQRELDANQKEVKTIYEMWDIKNRKLIAITKNNPPVFANTSNYYASISGDTMLINSGIEGAFQNWRYGRCIGYYRSITTRRNYLIGIDSTTLYFCENNILKDSINNITAYDVQRRTRYVLTGNSKGQVTAYKVYSVSKEYEFKPFNSAIRFLKLSPTEKYIVVKSDNQTIIWDRINKKSTELSGHKTIETIIFSADDAYFMITHPNGDAYIVETQEMQTVLKIPGNGNKIITAAISENFTYSILRENGSLFRSPIDNGIRIYKGHTNWVNDIAVAPGNNMLITASSDNTARIWDIETGKQISVFQGHTNWINAIDISPKNNYIISSGSDKKTIIWDLISTEKIRELSLHNAPVLVTKVSDDDKHFLTCSEDKILIISDFYGNQILKYTNDYAIQAAAFAHNKDEIAFAGKNRKVMFIDTKRKAAKDIEIQLKSTVNEMIFTQNDNYLLFACSDGNILVFDTKNYRQINTLSGHKHSVTSICQSPNGKYFLSASWDKTLKLWDAATFSEIVTINSHEDYITSAIFSPDGKYIISASADRTAKRWLSIEGVVEWIKDRHLINKEKKQ